MQRVLGQRRQPLEQLAGPLQPAARLGPAAELAAVERQLEREARGRGLVTRLARKPVRALVRSSAAGPSICQRAATPNPSSAFTLSPNASAASKSVRASAHAARDSASAPRPTNALACSAVSGINTRVWSPPGATRAFATARTDTGEGG